MVVRKVLCVDSLFMNPEELHWIRNGPKADPDICPGHHCAPGTSASPHQCNLQVRDMTWNKYRNDDSVYASISCLKIKLNKGRGPPVEGMVVLPGVLFCRWQVAAREVYVWRDVEICGRLLRRHMARWGGVKLVGWYIDGQGDDVQPDQLTLKKNTKTQLTLEFE